MLRICSSSLFESASFRQCCPRFLLEAESRAVDHQKRLSSSSTSQQPKVEESSGNQESIIAAVALERLPVVIPLPTPEVSEFRKFSFEWQQQYRRQYPQQFLDMLSANNTKSENMKLKFEPGPRITEADKNDDRRSLERALDRRLYLIVKGYPFGSSKDKAIWHFPEKVYRNEETLRLCAESVLIPEVANSEDVYYVGNAPCGHMCGGSANGSSSPVDYKRFFFRSQLLGNLQNAAWNYEDYAWVIKEELLDYFEPEESAYLKKMLVDDMRVCY